MPRDGESRMRNLVFFCSRGEARGGAGRRGEGHSVRATAASFFFCQERQKGESGFFYVRKEGRARRRGGTHAHVRGAGLGRVEGSRVRDGPSRARARRRVVCVAVSGVWATTTTPEQHAHDRITKLEDSLRGVCPGCVVVFWEKSATVQERFRASFHSTFHVCDAQPQFTSAERTPILRGCFHQGVFDFNLRPYN